MIEIFEVQIECMKHNSNDTDNDWSEIKLLT